MSHQRPKPVIPSVLARNLAPSTPARFLARTLGMTTSGPNHHEPDAMPLPRRHFLRWGLAVAMTGGVSLLVLAPRGQACTRVVSCGDCEQFAGCGLSKARLARKEDSHGR